MQGTFLIYMYEYLYTCSKLYINVIFYCHVLAYLHWVKLFIDGVFRTLVIVDVRLRVVSLVPVAIFTQVDVDLCKNVFFVLPHWDVSQNDVVVLITLDENIKIRRMT